MPSISVLSPIWENLRACGIIVLEMTPIVKDFSQEHEDYLHDESRLTGTAESISFPTSEEEIVEVIKKIRSQSGLITTQGARTGIVGGAVPIGGHILNLSRMNAVGDVHRDQSGEGGRLLVQPGAILAEVRKAIEPEGLFFPPDPTETTCSIGGMVAANASGAMTFHYGPTRKWIEALRVVLSNGDIIALRRGERPADGRSFSLTTEGGRTIRGILPSFTPPEVKSAAGYYIADDMDMLDLFVGMEGTLGIITEAELKLIPRPGAVNGLTVFLPSQDAAVTLVRVLRGERLEGFGDVSERPVAIEFFNHDALLLLRSMKADNPDFPAGPPLDGRYHTAVYIEFHGSSDEDLESPVMQAMEAAVVLGGSEDDTWFATTEREIEQLREFRHAVPEAANLLLDRRRQTCPGLTKLGTDMSVPDDRLNDVISMYDAGVSELGLESVMFGHIGNNHVHVNILPRCLEDYEAGRAMYLSWAKQVLEWGGSVSAEHGIGKLKAPFLRMMCGESGIVEMRGLKALFDPDMTLNPGNLFGTA